MPSPRHGDHLAGRGAGPAEQGAAGRHSGDYWVAVFGDPAGGQPWSWRFEGHHVSVTMTIAGDEVSPAPVFLGANPARVSYAGRPVSRPLAPEEDLARGLLDALGPAGRAAAVVAAARPEDIRTARARGGRGASSRPGSAAAELGPGAAALLRQLVAAYLDRLPAGLAPPGGRGGASRGAALRLGGPGHARRPGTTTGCRAMTC